MVFVDQDWLKERLGNEDLVVVDCRFKLGDPDYGFQQFKKSHIPGAIFMDLEKDLSGEVKEHGGRHPLPLVKNRIFGLSAHNELCTLFIFFRVRR